MSFFAGIFGRDDDDEKPRPPAESQPLGPSRRGLRCAGFGLRGGEYLRHMTTTFATTFGNDHPEWLVDNLVEAKARGMDAIVCLDLLLFRRESDGLHYRGTEEAQANARAIFQSFQVAGVLGLIWGLYLEELERREQNVSVNEIAQCNADMVAVMREFPELAHTKLMHCYGDGEDYRALHSFVGPDGTGVILVDAYNQDDEAVLTGIYARLEPQLLAGQSLGVVPCGADPWREPIRTTYRYAQANTRVDIIVMFIFEKYADGGKDHAGIDTNGMASEYLAAADFIKYAARNSPT